MAHRSVRTGLVVSLVFAALAFSACGDVNQTTGKAQTAAPSEPSYQDFGDFEVHYNAVRSDVLTVDVARAYGIKRSASSVLVNVSMLRKGPDGRTSPVDGEVTARAHNLNGQLKGLEIRRIAEGNSIYFIGEVGISGSEIIVFDIEATPADAGRKYPVQFKREFFAD